MKPVASAHVNEAIRLMSQGQSTRETAQQLGISQKTASRIYAANKENMPVNRGGRPRKLGNETVEFLKVNLKRGVFKSAVDAKKAADHILPGTVSVTTVRRRLQEAGLIARKMIKRPALKRAHI